MSTTGTLARTVCLSKMVEGDARADVDPAGLVVYSKTLAEKAAWEIGEKQGIDLVTINPSFVVGPVISNRIDATSVITVKVRCTPLSVVSFPILSCL